MKPINLLASLMVLIVSFTADAQDASWDHATATCIPGLHSAPNGPFAVMMYCEDALGDYLAVTYAKPIGAPVVQGGKWSLEDRYWSEPRWASDVTGYKWSDDGLKLSVSTSGIYGSGGLFELDLFKRETMQLLPKDAPVSINNPGPGYRIDGSVDEP
jgi:hypothetical protein